MSARLLFILLFCSVSSVLSAQGLLADSKVIDVEETMEEYIRENHIEVIEDIVHKFTSSKNFLRYLLEQGHHINPDSIQLSRRDVNVGKDIDVYVKHITDHQNFTMILVPVDIYPLLIYDTLLFAVLEVSDAWLKEKYYFNDLSDDSTKSALLALENHTLLTRHMYEQVMAERRQKTAEIEVKLHESYITTSSIALHTNELSKAERRSMTETWGLMKKLLSHNLELNVEMNIYIFGYDDMRVVQYLPGAKNADFKITPRNIFVRHHFLEE